MTKKQSGYSVPSAEPIPNGLHDIVQRLGLEPEKTYADYGAVYSQDSRMMSPDPTLGVINQVITSLARGQSHVLTLPLPAGLLEYQERYIGVNPARVCEAPVRMTKANHYIFPDQDIMQNLLRAAEEVCPPRFDGAVFLPLMTSPETEMAAQKLGGRTLISPQQSYHFNSKIRVATQAAAEGYHVAPHVVVPDDKSLESQFAALKNEVLRRGVNPDTARYWVKFDNLFAGLGVLRYEPAKDDLSRVTQWVAQTRKETSVGDIPLMIDLDIGQLPGVRRIIDNFNVQAVVGADRVSMTGVTLQKTVDGRYNGGSMPLTAEKKLYAEEARKWGYPVLTAAQRQGYRGYAGIDVMLCEMQDGSMRGYVLEMNGRLNGSTSLLSLNHYVAEQSGSQDTVSHNIVVSFSRPLDDFAMCKEKFGNLLYRGSESDYAGIVPLVVHKNGMGKISQIKTVAVAPDQKSLSRLNRLYTEMMQIN